MDKPPDNYRKQIEAVTECVTYLGAQCQEVADDSEQVFWAGLISTNAISVSAAEFASRFNKLVGERGVRSTYGPNIKVLDDGVRITMAAGYSEKTRTFVSTCAAEIVTFLEGFVDEICADIEIEKMSHTLYLRDRIMPILIRERNEIMKKPFIDMLYEPDLIEQLRVAQAYQFTYPDASVKDAIFNSIREGLLNPIKIGQYLYYLNKFLKPAGYQVDQTALYKAVEIMPHPDIFALMSLEPKEQQITKLVNRKECFDPAGAFLGTERIDQIVQSMASDKDEGSKCPALSESVWQQWMSLMELIMEQAEAPNQEYLDQLKIGLEKDVNSFEYYGQLVQVGCLIKCSSDGVIELAKPDDAHFKPLAEHPFLKPLVE